MRIVQLGPVPPPHGGVSMNLLAIDRALIQLGHESMIIDVTDRDGEQKDDRILKPRSAFGLIKLLLRIDSDIVHYHIGGDFSLKLAALTLLCGILPGKRSVVTFHSGGFARRAARTARPFSFRGFALRSIDLLIGVNDDMITMFKAFGVDERRARLILPFELTSPDPTIEVPSELTQFADGCDPFLLSVGGLEPEYGNEFLVESMPDVIKAFPKAGLMIVGSGRLRSTLENSIDAHGLRERVVLTGDIDHSIVLHLMERADALIRMTEYDGDSIAVREALHLGTPVIASDKAPRPAGTLVLASPVGTGQIVQAVREVSGWRLSPTSDADGGPGNAEKILEAYAELLTE